MFFADPGALAASGVVTVQEYGSSPRRSHRLVSTKTTTLLHVDKGAVEAGEALVAGAAAMAGVARLSANAWVAKS